MEEEGRRLDSPAAKPGGTIGPAVLAAAVLAGAAGGLAPAAADAPPGSAALAGRPAGLPPLARGFGPHRPAPHPPEEEDGPPLDGPSLAELMRVPDAVPRPEPRSRYGNPPAYVANGRLHRTLRASGGYVERGVASWYGRKFHERPTSSREPYDMFAMTAAHRSLPLPTYVRVTHLGNGRSVVVRVNDRGPFHDGRIIDLSYAAAAKLGLLGPGSGPVEIRAIPTGPEGRDRPSHEAAPAPVRLYVQIGAYSVETNARRVHAAAAKLRPGLASITRFGTRGGVLHRVRIGPLPGLEEADRVVNELGAVGMRDARVVIEDPNEEAAEDDNA